MLSAFFDDDGEHQPDLITIGQVEESDIYQDRCCAGFGWEVRLIFPDELHPEYTTYWGMCLNPDCPKYEKSIGPSDHYRGVSSICYEDLAEWLAYRDMALHSNAAQQVAQRDLLPGG